MSWELVLDKPTPAYDTYSGAAQLATFEFAGLPEQLDFVNNWLLDNILDNFQSEIQNRGGTLLRITLWRDIEPTFKTPYWCEVLSGVPAVQPSSRVRIIPFLWQAIIAVALLGIIAWLIIKPVLRSVTDLAWGPPGPGGEREKPFLGIPWVGWIALGFIAIPLVRSLRREK